MMKLLIVCWVLTLSAASPAVDPALDTTSTCRCVPNKWTGILSSTEREFDLSGGRSNFAHSDVLVFYDYERKRFAMVDMETGSKAIADYDSVSCLCCYFGRVIE
ncbi:hypothetical protein LSAT2_015940 [Lamellibrachia satsuma]|nr:hypothetical protein LSAT2_015940 [Lamellibrachia satsuma]